MSCSATGGGTCGGFGNARTVKFASLAPGASETITLSGVVSAQLAEGYSLVNIAIVGSNLLDPAPLNNIEVITTRVERPAPVKPVLQCVMPLGGNSFRARFGYENSNPISVSIPIGGDNRLTPGQQDQGQPTTFAPGIHPFAFDVVRSGGSVSWILNGMTVTASASSPNQCSQ